jgi:opacity protein-like surface antigen
MPPGAWLLSTTVPHHKESLAMKSFTKPLMRSALFMLTLGVAAPASADVLLTPYLGVTFGTGVDLGDLVDFDGFDKKTTYGGTLTWMGAGFIGLEIDFGVTPDFFEADVDEVEDTLDTRVTSFMGNLVVGIPLGGQQGFGFRPYGSGGLGLLRSHFGPTEVFDDIDRDDLGLDVGGGAYLVFTNNVGLRGDLRYFRSLTGEDEDEFEIGLRRFDFWRGTVGITFRF